MIASALNRIIHNTRFKKKVSLEEMKAHKDDRFLRGRQIAYLIYEYFRVTGANDSVENYADLFTIVLRNDNNQEFDSKWDEILLSMTKIPSDDIFERLYKLRILGSEKLKTVLELYNMEIHQKKAGPDYHRLKTMVKRSIEQDIRNKNFGAKNGNYERDAVVKNQETQQREQRTLGDCWQWRANGQCSKGDNCSFRHDINKRAKTTQSNPSPSCFMQQNERKSSRTRSPEARVPVEECFDCPARITSKELAPIHSGKSGILQNACSTSPKMDAGLGRKWSCARRQVDWIALQKVFKEWWQKCSGYVENHTTIRLRIIRIWSRRSLHIDFAEELKHTETNPMCKIHKSRRTSCWHSRPKSIAWNDLPRWSSPA